MLAVAPETIADAIVSTFAVERELTVVQLRRHIERRYFHCSPRAVYKELKRLIARGVVVKVKKRYALSVSWILSLIQFSEQLYSTSVRNMSNESLLPHEGGRISWHFRDLLHLDRLWLQLIFLLFEKSYSRTMFVWVPHFWFDLVHYEKDLEAQEAMKVAGNRMYMMLGGRTYLDQLPTKYWSRQVYEWSYAEGPFEKDRATYFDVIDDYVLTVTLDAVTAMKIADLFRRVRGKSDLGLIREFDAIKTGARAKLQLERNAKKAARLRRKCCEFFGIVDPSSSATQCRASRLR